MSIGAKLRLRRIMNSRTGRVVIFPLDHGVTFGLMRGLEDMTLCLQNGIDGGADAFVLHKGMMRLLECTSGKLPGVFMHLCGSTQLGTAVHHKVVVGSVEEAIMYGADGVSYHINLGNEYEPEMLRDLGVISGECIKWQMPLLVMTYVRGRYAGDSEHDKAISHAVRLAAELGADIVKTAMPSSFLVLERIVKSVSVPVVIAGGSKAENPIYFLENVERAIQAGASGVAVGRNVFQHERPRMFLRAIGLIVHGGLSAKDAIERASEEEFSNATP
ncbi:MAG: 2-amino-3,7-dideoxy-D-threo-hept-6-ulosonate synthase [Syntrophobacterales bacterium]|nr:2-amino-3,7-dideoxy-D-threo-hept-6-ulosonate synthase [Syntrophobacterales bacterium]